MDIKEVASMGGQATSKRHGKQHYQSMGRKSAIKRLNGLTSEQRSEYFRKVRAGNKPTENV